MERQNLTETLETENNLRRYLPLIPHPDGPDAHVKSRIKSNVFNACFFALSRQGRLCEEIFPHLPRTVDESVKRFEWTALSFNNTPFFDNYLGAIYSHAKGQACARIFQSGESLFRCTECSYDDSCVLCAYCFNPDDHVGHDVIQYGSMGSGMCDCGDESAFVHPLNCKCLQSAEETIVSTDLEDSLWLIIQVVLDYIIDIGSISLTNLPAVREFMALQTDDCLLEEFSRLCTLPEKYGVALVSGYELVLWKSPIAKSVQNITLSQCLGITADQAATYTNYSNSFGKTAIASADNPAELKKAKIALDERNMPVSILPARGSVAELVASLLISWLQYVSERIRNSSVRNAAKRITAELLLQRSEDEQGKGKLTLFETKFKTTLTTPVPLWTLLEGAILQYKVRDDIDEVGFDFDNMPNNFTQSISIKPLTRVQRLLTYDVRFPLAMREKLDSFLILVLMHEQKYKEQLCFQFLELFPGLLYLLAFSDQDVEQSCINSISIQVFMCPPTNNSVVNSDILASLFAPVLSLAVIDSTINQAGYPNMTDHLSFLETRPPMILVHQSLRLGIDMITHVFSKNDAENILNMFLKRENLVFFVLYQSLFQGMGASKRVTGAHVEHEDFLQFRYLLHTASPILEVISAVNKAQDLKVDNVRQSLPLLLKLIARPKNENWLAKSPVTQLMSSFFHPMNYFLTTVIRRGGIDVVIDVLRQNQELFDGICDLSLRSIVFGSQVKIGTWIRNGEMLSRLGAMYTSGHLAALSYYHDFHLIQTQALVDEPSQFFSNLLERWELNEWISDHVAADNTIYEQRFSFACEQFIIFVYNLFAMRRFFDLRETADQELLSAQKSIVYELATGPQVFSSLYSKVKRFDLTPEQVSVFLSEVADYQPPLGLTDSGIYRLKPFLYEEIDPISLFLDSGSSQTTFMILVESIAKIKQMDPSRVSLRPHIDESSIPYVNDNIGNFLRTKEFAKFAYKLLQFGLDTKDDSIFAPLLHLVHAVVLDDERLYGEKYINPLFVSYPLCNLLLFIADSLVSPNAVAKSELLLDLFIAKDENVTQLLSLCFGELHIKNYKAKRREPDKKRKRSQEAVEKRKAKILSKFAKQRQSFLQNNTLEEDECGRGREENELKARCVACGEEESVNDKFGLPFALSCASISWFIPDESLPFFAQAFRNYWDTKIYEEKKSKSGESVCGDGDDENKNKNSPLLTRFDNHFDFEDEPDDFVPEVEKHYSADDCNDIIKDECSGAADMMLFPKSSKKRVVLPFTCSHAIHERCGVGAHSNGRFPCPLCDQEFSKILPSYYYLKESFVPRELLEGNPEFTSYKELFKSISSTKNSDILRGILHNDYFNDGKIKTGVPHPTPEIFHWRRLDDSSLFENLTSVTELLANLICSHEIASRLDGVQGMSDFVETFPASAITLARTLVQNRVMLFYQSAKDISASKLEEGISKSWKRRVLSTNVFGEVLALFFQTKESLQTVMRVGFVMVIRHAVYALNRRFGPFTVECTEEIEPLVLKKFCELEASWFGEAVNRENTKHIFWALQKCVVPYLRQCVLLKHLLTCSRLSDNEYLGVDLLDSIRDFTEEWTATRYINSLCSCLSIPSLNEILRNYDVSDRCASLLISRRVFESKLLNEFNSDLRDICEIVQPIQYPNAQRLIQLPKDYIDARRKDMYSYTLSFICLHCGERLEAEQSIAHRRKCSSMGIMYALRANALYVAFSSSGKPYDAQLPGPYMTEHGEVKDDAVPGDATLNEARYKYLNKIWLNNELFGFASRSSYGIDRDPLGVEALESEEEGDNFQFDEWN